MRYLEIEENKNFVGRRTEILELNKISISGEPNIIVMYGRRRVGKTELLEQVFRTRNLIKLEGIEGFNSDDQLKNAVNQLAVYTDLDNPSITSWTKFFIKLHEITKNEIATIYLEELQWLASDKTKLISELKYVWDNYFRRNKNIIIILCGSSPSFMIENVIHSKSLYNRSQYEFNLQEFNLIEVKSFFSNKSNSEVLSAYLTVGGMLLYLKWIGSESSTFLGICKSAFVSNGALFREYEKIFTSTLSSNTHYREIIELLSNKKFMTREEIATSLKIKSGGGISKILRDLEKSGFIQKYTPYNLGENSKLSRYTIVDNYLQFYFKFIFPIRENINKGEFRSNPVNAINKNSYLTWLGFAFEKFCRKYSYIIANILGFSAVRYTSGVFFNKSTESVSKGYQIDLLFDRDDGVYTICEIKYSSNKISKKVIDEFSNKIEIFPNKKNKTIHQVLIASSGVEESVKSSGYFDSIITMDDLFKPYNW